jgi:hypothetical protein
MAVQPALIPTGPIWVVRLGQDGGSYWFTSGKTANWVAEHVGMPTSNFVTKVLPGEELAAEDAA